VSLTIRREKVSWHNGDERFRLMHLSDFHLKGVGRRLCAIEAIIAIEKPDVIAMTGDYYDTPRGARLFLEFLERVSRIVPVYWVEGNHDRWFGRGNVLSLTEIQSALCVDDERREFVSKRGFHYQFVSWRQWLKHEGSNPRKGRQIILMHNPEEIRGDRLGGSDLVLAGHLHGGQFVLGKTRNQSNFPGSILYRWCGDRYDVDGTTVIVSRGLGDTVPVRFRCPYEVVIIEVD
jgi:uncharacterized protein